MLANNFLSADELGIAEDERWAAATLLGMMERGDLADYFVGNHTIANMPDRSVKNGFSMKVSGPGSHHKESECGTAACIGGWMAILMKQSGRRELSANLYVQSIGVDHPLHDLFYNLHACIYEAPVATSALALRNFLTTGKPNWEEVLPTLSLVPIGFRCVMEVAT